ncbi:MAG: hypothetical protein ACRDQ6_20450 [Pseudonocardiaceae bacterium]
MAPTRRRLTAQFAIGSVAVISVGACGGGGGHLATGSSGLSSAVDRMSALQSVRIVEHSSGPDTTPEVITLDYQAPDRLRSTQTGVGAQASIQIGATLYLEEFGQLGYYRPAALPASRGPAQSLLAGLQALKQGSVVQQGDTYRRVLPGSAGSLTARLDNGYVVELTTETNGVQLVQEFSLFNQAPEVVAPAADHLLPPLAAPPSCVPGQPPTAVLCVDTGPPTTEQQVKLPSLPSSFSPSTLQIRTVANAASTAVRRTTAIRVRRRPSG